MPADAMARLTAEMWVSAYLARLRAMGIPAFLAAKGDPTAGAVIVVVATMDGRARVSQRSFDPMTGERTWMILAEGSEAEVEEAVRRQRSFDPDLWVVEVEDPKGRDLLSEEGLA